MHKAANKQSAIVRRVPKQKRSIEKHNKIISCAMELMAEIGPENVSTHQVAERAGISVGSLYQFFNNIEMVKTAVIERLMETLFNDLISTIERTTEYNFVSLTDSLIDTTLNFTEQNKSTCEVIVLLWHSEEFVRVNDKFNEQLITAIADFLISHEKTRKRKDLLIVIRVIMSVGDAMSRLIWSTKDDEEIQAYAKEWKLLSRSYAVTSLITK
jgi:AcrR family transcriptional regulator